MSGRRRVQRSVRITVAAGVLVVAAFAVMVAIASSRGVGFSAAFALVGGVVSARILCAEVVHTRQQAARDRAAQARSFGCTLAAARTDRLHVVAQLAERLDDRDRRILDLEHRIRGTEARLHGAEVRGDREAHRADDVQVRLNEVLDQVLARVPSTASAGEDPAPAPLPGRHNAAWAPDGTDLDSADSERLPSVVELLTWEAGASSRQRSWRREA